MAAFFSLLNLKCPANRRDDAIAQFLDGKIIESCRDTVPGFVSGRLLRSMDDPGATCVLVEWQDKQAFEDWMSSPVRGARSQDSLFEPPGRSHLFEVVHEVRRQAPG